MKIVILSAGAGSRFTRRGISQPKTLLEVFGRPVLEHNLLAFLDHGCSVVVVGSLQVTAWIREKNYPGVTAVDCPVLQSGPVMSALLASAYIHADEPVMIVDGDQIYARSVIPSIVAGMTHPTRIVAARTGKNPNWCSVVVHENHVTLKEKGNDSDFVVAGGYGFWSWSLFLSSAYSVLNNSLSTGLEPKMSYTITTLNMSTEVVRLEKDEWTSVGTPEELEELKC